MGISFIYDDRTEGHKIEGYAWQASIYGKNCKSECIHEVVLEAVGKSAKQMRQAGTYAGCKRFSHDSQRIGYLHRFLHGPQWGGCLRVSHMHETQPVDDVKCNF